MSSNQFNLLKQSKFVPLFIVQALGAFNDNIFKNSLMLLLTFGAATKLPIDTNLLMNLCAGLFILPFLLFSGTAGRLADKIDMDVIIRRTKLAEIIIMAAATVAYYYEAYTTLIFILFLMGTQSTFFGPVKYAYLPKKLDETELVGGNALIEMGTFISILMGTIYGGILIGLENPVLYICMSILSFSIAGYIASFFVPRTPTNNPDISISVNFFAQTLSAFKVSLKYRDVFFSMMAISWFWFLGSAYLTQIPNFTKTILYGNNEVVTLLLATFSIGVALGSLICEKLSRKHVEIGLVPLATLGITLSGILLYLSTPVTMHDELIGANEFLSHTSTFYFLFSLLAIGFFGGIYSVPLMAYVQYRSDDDKKAQNIAALNILNALFMVMSALCGVVFLSILEFSITEFFLLLAIVNLVFTSLIFYKAPVFISRCLEYLPTLLAKS